MESVDIFNGVRKDILERYPEGVQAVFEPVDGSDFYKEKNSGFFPDGKIRALHADRLRVCKSGVSPGDIRKVKRTVTTTYEAG
jgi:hypothetical protein